MRRLRISRLGALAVSASLVITVLLASVFVLLFSSFSTGQEAPGSCPLVGGFGSFIVRGTVLNSSFHNATSLNQSVWNLTSNGNYSVNVSIYNMSFSGFGEPQRTFVNQTTTAVANGTFELKVGPGSCAALYTMQIASYNASSWNTHEIGPSLPPVPTDALISFLDNSTFYLQPAATLNFTAINKTDNISFNYVIFDDSLGFPLAENFQSLVWNATVVVPRAKNYTIMLMKSPQFDQPGNPFSTALPPQTIQVQNASNFSGTEFVINLQKNLSFDMFTISGNISVAGNSTPVNVTQVLVKLGIAGMVPPNSNVQIPGGTVINQTPGGNDPLANYSVTVMGANSGIYQILEFYASNSTSMSSGEGDYFAYFSNFTVTGHMVHNLTLKRLAGNYSTISGFTNLNTSYITVNISDASGQPLDDAHTELKVDMVGHRTVFPTFRYMVDQLSGGLLRLPILSDSNATLLIFNRQFAPMRLKLNITNASREPNGIIQVTLNAFKPRKFHANGSSEDFSGAKAGQFRMTFMRNSDACNVFNASVESCKLFPNDFDAGGFNPLKVMATGKVNMLMEINTTGVKIYFIGVDMLASGPPEASMSEEALRETSNGTSFEELFKFGSVAPNIYDRVLVGIPYNYSRLDDSNQINFTLKALYDDTGTIAWNASQTPNASIPSDWSDYNTGWFNTTSGGMACTDSEGTNVTNSTCFINKTTNYVWIHLPHFSDGEGGPQGGDSTPAKAPAPVNFTATPSGTVMINWTDVDGETGESYIVYRSVYNLTNSTFGGLGGVYISNYTGINITNLTATTRISEGVQYFIDNTTLNGSVYYYAVAAVDATGNLQNVTGGQINISSSPNYNVTVNDTVMPRPVSNMTVTASGATVTITWLNVTQDVSGSSDFHNLTYYIYRSAANETNIVLNGTANVTQSNISTFVKSVAGTSNSTTVTLVKGTYHFAVLIADDGGNQNLTVGFSPSGPSGNYGNVSVTPAASSSSSSSSTSGGGGGGGTPAVSEGVKVSKNWDVLPAGTASMSIAKAEIGFTNIDFTTSVGASNVEITVTKLAAKPVVKREVQGTANQYIRIDKTNLREADVTSAKIEFKVEKKWFDQNSGSIKNIVLQRYFNELWTTLDTKYLRADETYQYFEATSPGLSLFAIVLKPVASAGSAVNGTVNVSGAADTGNASETGSAAGQKSAGVSSKTLVYLVLAVVVAAVAGGAFFVIKKKGGGFSIPNPFSKLKKGGSGSRSRSKPTDEEEADKIVKEYESQQSVRPKQKQQDPRGRPPEAFN